MYICISNIAFCELLCRHCCDDDRQATRQTIASALLDPPSLPFCLPISSEQWHQIYRSIVGALGRHLAPRSIIDQWHECEVCPFCLKIEGAPPSSTHACVSCNAPMYAWCGFYSCGKQEAGGGYYSEVYAILVWLEANTRPLGVSNSHQ